MKINETAEAFFTSERGEVSLYEKVESDFPVKLPLTRAGFEAFLKRAADFGNLPVDDSCRKVICAWIHGIENVECTSTIETASKILHKSLSNALTWTIDQEIKAKQNAELEALRAKARAEAEEAARKVAIEKAADKRQKKSNRVSMKSKPDEAKAN